MQAEYLATVTVELPITLAEIKQHLIVEHDEDDALITRYLIAAMDYAEPRTELSTRVKRYRVLGRCWPCDGVLLPHGPVRRVESVTYLDSENELQTLAADTFGIYQHYGQQVLEFHDIPPSVGSHRRDAVSVQYLAGYGTLADEVADSYGFPYTLPFVLGDAGMNVIQANARIPERIKQAIFMLVGHWYENRETVVVGTISGPLAVAADDLLHSARVMGV